MPGLTAAGLEIATLADVREQVGTAWRAAFGQSMDVSDRSPDGQLIGIVSEVFALFWELLEAIKSARDPNAALDAFLDAIAALTGTFRRAATFSTVTLTLTGTPTSVIPTDRLVSSKNTGQQFKTMEAGTIVAATAWSDDVDYLDGDRRTNSGSVYLCVTPGHSPSGGTGPEGVDPDPDIIEADGTAGWRFLGEGTGYVDVAARATVTGPVVAVAGDLIGRDTPVGGWLGVTNILDAALGATVMTNAQLRVLREAELGRPGTGPKGGIRAALLDVDLDTLDPVTSATVFSNVTDVTDVDGVPPHSVEALVRGGSDQSIWNALLANVADGIRTHGSVVGTAIDSAGTSYTMKFSRVTEQLVYVAVTLVKDPNTYPADGDDQVRAAIATWGNGRDDGTDVVSSAVLAQLFTVTGVLDADKPFIGLAPTPLTTTTIAVSLRSRAVFDTTRVTVATSNGVP